MPFARTVLRGFVLAAFGLVAIPGQAQLDLDNTELIETLSRRQMTALLDRLIEVDPPTDAADRWQLEIARARLTLQRLEGERDAAFADGDAEAAAVLDDQVNEAFDALLDAQRALVAEPGLADRRERAIWMTDLAETLLFEQLRGRANYAAEFVEFGLPTVAQREAVASAAVEALVLAAGAEAVIFDAQRYYGGNDGARQRDQANQLYYRVIEDYGQQRTPLVAAVAMHLVSMLPEEAAYFQDPERVDAEGVSGRRDDPDHERVRLQRGAAERLDTLLRGDPGPAEDAARSRLGRVRVAMGDSAGGLDDQLDPLVKAGATGLPGLLAGLGRAAALRDLGRYPAALETLDELRRQELVEASPLLRLLLTDARFLTLTARATSDAAQIAAYDAYFDMLRQPEVRDVEAALRSMIYQRWTDALEVGQDVSGLPAAVRMAVGQASREAGQRARFVDDDEAEAQRQFEWSVRVNQGLTGEDLPDAVRASALFNRSLAQVLLDGDGVATLLEAVRSWTEVAERYPREPMAEQAITFAADYVTALVQQAPDHPAVGPQYEKTMNVLFSRYDETDTAGKHRLYYAFRVYQQKGQYERAAQEYARVPFGHDQYFEAQSLRLFNLQQVYEQTPSDATDPDTGRKLRDARRSAAVSAAEQVRDEADRAAQRSTDAAARELAHRALGAAVLTLATADLDAGDPDAALARLDALEARFADDPGSQDVYRDAVSRRIVTLVSAGRFDAASNVAEAMMSRFPDAAAGVIGQVLQDLESRVAALRRRADEAAPALAQPLREEASTLAAVTSTLANLLVAWAEGQDLDRAAMLAYELPYVRALRVAGRPADAWQFMKDRGMLDHFADHLDVMEAAGETLYAMGVTERPRPGGTAYVVVDEAAALAAIPWFDRIIRGLDAPYPEEYWNVWLRRLAINIALGRDVEKVPLRIRQLEAANPGLGGPAFAERFGRLAVDARGAAGAAP